MEKQYRSAYVLGKFMPFHNGHIHLIDTAISKSDKVTVVVGTLPTEPIPGELRFKWVKEHYRTNPNVTVVHCTEVLPQYPEEHVDFWKIWVGVVNRYCPADIDVIFTSELYGETYAQHLGIEHHLVDLERKIIPTSGTKIRNKPFDMWDTLPHHVRPYFVKRIAIMGCESCGKSTLTRYLAEHYNTNYVEEYGRTVYENNGGFVTVQDFKIISDGRQLIENAMIKQSNKLLFVDTEDITTSVFLTMYHPHTPYLTAKYLNKQELADWWELVNVEDYLKDQIKIKPNYDLYILLTPDCQAVQDGTRKFLDTRKDHHIRIKAELIAKKCNFVEIGGTWTNRFEQAKKVINKEYNI